MAIIVSICEGRPFDMMVRGAELALALAEQASTTIAFAKSDGYSPWRHLLSAPQQMRLRALGQPVPSNTDTLEKVLQQLQRGDSPTTEEMAATSARLRQDATRCLVVRTGAAITVRPPERASLFLLTDAARAPAARLRPFERAYACAAANFTPPSGLEILPVAVQRGIFAPPRKALPRGVLLIGDGDRASNLRFARWLQDAGARVCLFDPYFCANDYPELDAGLAFADACAPAVRAQHFATCSAVVVACAGVRPDNHFLWECVAMGLAPLGYLVAPACAAWSAVDLAEAWTAHTQAAVPQGVPEVADWATLIAAILEPSPRPRERTAPAEVFPWHPHQARVFHSLEQAAANSLPEGFAAAALLSPGPDVQPSAALEAFLSRYQEVYIDLAENPALAIWLADMQSRWTTCDAAEAGPLLLKLTPRVAPVHLDVIHLEDTAARVAALRAVMHGLAERARAGGLTTLPQILVHADKLLDNVGMSRRGIGIAVATEAILGGLENDAPGRYQLHFLGRPQGHSQRGRVYFYPYRSAVGMDHDEVDYPTLPKLLQDNRVDLLLNVDPFLVGGLTARTLWARKPVPLVGMLHSIHTALGSTEVLLQLMSGPTFAFDAIVAPSHCGAVAYQGLFDAASAWLARSMPAPPRFHGRVEVIPYGIDASFYLDLQRLSCRAALSLPTDGPIMLCVGRFDKQEKADLVPLLLATQDLQRRHPNVLLILMGGKTPRGKPDYAAEMRKLAGSMGIARNVCTYEDVAADDKVLMLGAADIFVAVSDNIQETYGLTILEAMAASLPVVAAGWDGYRELVRHGRTGFLVPTYSAQMPEVSQHVQRLAEGVGGYGHRDLHESVVVDPYVLAADLEQLIVNPTLRKAFGEEGRRVCLADYDQTKQARVLGDFLADLLRQAQKAAWPPASTLRPFVDPVYQRFAHYPSGGSLTDSTPLVASFWAHDKAWRTALLTGVGITQVTERALVEAAVNYVGQHGPISVGTLAKALAGTDYAADAIKPRLARCVKYGFLRLGAP